MENGIPQADSRVDLALLERCTLAFISPIVNKSTNRTFAQDVTAIASMGRMLHDKILETANVESNS